MKALFIALVLWCLVVALPASASGQGAGIEQARFRWGPLGLSPRVALTNLGLDSNVYNSDNPDDQARDFTATVSPGADTWLRVGVAQLSLRTSVDWTYFRRAVNQRWFGLTQDGRFDLLFNRLNPYVSGSYSTTRQRPNFEIDARVRQKAQRLAAGTALRIGARLSFDLEAAHSSVDFADRDFGDSRLAGALNRETREASVTGRVVLTPLTTFTMRTAVEQDRFETSLFRDSRSVLFLPGFEMQPRALVSGRAAVGLRLFDASDPLVPDFRGVVAAVDASYIAREMTRFSVSVDRDVDYSAEAAQPYSVVTTAGLTVTQVIGLDWYVLARGSRARLDYRGFPGGIGGDVSEARRDYVTTVGGGVARRIGLDVRLGLDVDRVSRRSPVNGRNYDGYRVGGSISYGTN